MKTHSGNGKTDIKNSQVLRQAIMERRAVVVPGCHDAMSAKIIADCGFKAIQVSGYGLAASLLAKPDVGLVQMKDVLDVTWNIAINLGLRTVVSPTLQAGEDDEIEITSEEVFNRTTGKTFPVLPLPQSRQGHHQCGRTHRLHPAAFARSIHRRKSRIC